MSDIRLSRNFKLSEMKCKCGNCETTVDHVDMYLIQQLQRLRDAFGLPIKIASGHRCREHNLAIGGAPNSQHIYGKAVDIDTKHLSAVDKYRLVQMIMRSGAFKGVGIGKKTTDTLHVDVRDSEAPVLWMY